jgi:hypothetical protein
MLEAGAWYHVINRGNNRQHISMSAGDYEHFLDILAKGCVSFKDKAAKGSEQQNGA